MTTNTTNLVQGRCWRQTDMARELATLCYFERASAHILAGWLPRPQISISSSVWGWINFRPWTTRFGWTGA